MHLLSKQTVIPDCNVLISQQYRQSLQPYAEPEMLEVAYYQPQQQQAEQIKKYKVSPNKRTCYQRLFMVLVTILCLAGVAYHHQGQLLTGLSFLRFSNLAVK